jgi:hypothetical protein
MSAKYILPIASRGAPVRSPMNSGRRILVVEDERDLRLITAEVLIAAGYQVDVAENGWPPGLRYNFPSTIS